MLSAVRDRHFNKIQRYCGLLKYRVSQKKLYTFITLNFRSLLNIYANVINIYGNPDSIAF